MGTREQQSNKKAVQEGVCQKFRSTKVPVLYVLIGPAISVPLIIIFSARLAESGVTPEPKVEHCSPAADCGDDWVIYRRKCYYFSDKIDTWRNSQNFCQSHNSSLVIIHNEDEMNFLNLVKSNNYWIGLSRTQDDSGWVWTDGTLYPEPILNIYRKPVLSGELENVYLNGDGFKSESGRYPKKWICSKNFLGHPP